MKNLTIAVGMLVIGISFACASCASNVFPIKGNGNLKTSEKDVSSFEKIRVGGSAEVRFHLSNEYRAVVTVDSNLVEYTEVKTRGDVLNIGTKMGNYSFTKYLVDIYCPTLTGVSISGSGRFSGNDTITASAFNINVSGSGKINGTIDCDNFSAKISGSGNISITGNSKDSDIVISGSGNFAGTEFNVNNADIRISGSGKISIYAADNLKANISGSGEVKYLGNPKIETSISGSGKIKKL